MYDLAAIHIQLTGQFNPLTDIRKLAPSKKQTLNCSYH